MNKKYITVQVNYLEDLLGVLEDALTIIVGYTGDQPELVDHISKKLDNWAQILKPHTGQDLN